MYGDTPVLSLHPQDPGLQMHCSRVAALGQAVAHHLFLPTEQKTLLYAASLVHHRTAGWEVRLTDSRPVEGEIRALLSAFAKPGGGTEAEQRLAGILRIADAYDQQYQMESLKGRSEDGILCGLRKGVSRGLWGEELVDALEHISTAESLGSPSHWRLPTFAPAAARILSLMQDSEIDLHRLEEAAGSDPATAGRLLSVANSAAFPFRMPVSTLRAAIARLGFRTSRKVIAASITHVVLASRGMESLWLHSLETADLAEQLGQRVHGINPGEAFLCGLLHDVGRLVRNRLSIYDSARLLGLEDGGCPTAYAERATMGVDHAELGAELADYWRLPSLLTEAIRNHHEPEATRSRLAHLLYLTEYLTGGEEDIPSRRRLTIALEGVGISLEDAHAVKATGIANWLAAA